MKHGMPVAVRVHLNKQAMTRKLIKVSATHKPLRVVGSKSHRDPLMPEFLAYIGEHDYQVLGSILKVGGGEGNAIYTPDLSTSEWDTAAAQIIVEEAGGHFLQTDMQPMRYNTKDSLLNPYFFVFGRDFKDWSQYLL